MRTLLVLVAAAALYVPSAAAATKAERCEKYKEELARIEEAKRRGGSEARLHKLESKRQKILAARAKHHC
jgi:hypothetical protein